MLVEKETFKYFQNWLHIEIQYSDCQDIQVWM